MKKMILLCCCLMVAAMAWADVETNILATPSDKGSAELQNSPFSVAYQDLDDYTRTQLKEHFYVLIERANAGLASDAELEQINFMSAKYHFDAPFFLVPGEDPGRDEGTLDQGSVDTVANCATATVIPDCPYNTSGNFDGDNDCSVSAASPYNEVFYTFTPTITGFYQMRVRSQSGGVAAIRVMSGACCAGATSIAFSSNTVSSTDCARPDSAGNEPGSSVTYTRATLTAGVQYWIHVGTSSSTAGIVAAYQFNLWCVPCPTVDALFQTEHDVCSEAVEIACNDSIMADSSSATTVDWFKVILPVGTYDSLIVKVFAREWGHCISGLYPQNSPLSAVDCRFSIWKDNGTCPGDSLIGDDDGTHGYLACSVDAMAGVCAGPGTYYIRVYNFSGLGDYIVTTRCVPCPPPLDCNTFLPCGTPAEIEPNNVCADIANFGELACGSDGATANYYGTICPQLDVDYWHIAPTALGQIVIIDLFDGADCNTPAVGLRMRGATATDGTCAAATGTATARYVLGRGGCYPLANTGGYIGVVRNTGSEAKYRIAVRCSTATAIACPQVVMPKQFCIGPCAGPIVDIRPAQNYPIAVGLNEIIDDLNVRLSLQHTFDGDLDIFLVTPWADTLELSSDNGSSGDDYRVTLLDDEATTLVTAGVAPFNGSFIPEELLAAVDGQNANGLWNLLIFDDTNGDSGYVECACLEFTSHPACTPTEFALFNGENSDPEHAIGYPAYQCIDVCAGSGTLIRVCSVTGDPLDPTKTPRVSVTAGCDPVSTHCDRTCDAGQTDPAADGSLIPDASWGYNEALGCFETVISGVSAGCICVGLEGFLAVELTGFDATIGDSRVTLNWSTASETSNDHFIIERDGASIGSVVANGTAIGGEYHFTDANAVNGTTYSYTLFAVDGSGSRTELRSIDATPMANAGVVTEYALHQNFPNPFNPETNIQFDLLETGIVSLNVYNVLGQAVAALIDRNMEAGRHTVSFQATDLPSGIYIYRLEVNGFVAQKKMILMK